MLSHFHSAQNHIEIGQVVYSMTTCIENGEPIDEEERKM